jgi:hypothetical protein
MEKNEIIFKDNSSKHLEMSSTFNKRKNISIVLRLLGEIFLLGIPNIVSLLLTVDNKLEIVKNTSLKNCIWNHNYIRHYITNLKYFIYS